MIDLFGDRDTRDELGLGGIRDAFADLFFPGISTIQTRARYFLFVPWIYLDLERRQKSSSEIAVLARQAEVKLIDVLAETEGEKKGVIGFSARHTLKRLPSNVYWQGLGVWGIRQFEGGQDGYHRSLDYFHATIKARKKLQTDEAADGAGRNNWHPGLPACLAGFPASSDFALTESEALYLQERILTQVPDSLLAFFLRENHAWNTEQYDFPWEHPAVERASPKQRQQLNHAELFSLVMYGAVVLYNLILSEQVGHEASKDWVDVYEAEWDTWADAVAANRKRLDAWDRPAFWKLVESLNERISLPTARFVDEWIAVAGQPGLANKRHDLAVRTLIIDREKKLKGAQARVGNARALELFGGNAGAARLNYRWGKAERIALDILKGLHGDDD